MHPSTARWGQSLLARERLALVALVEITRGQLRGKPPVDVGQLAVTLSVPQSHFEGLIEEFVKRGVLLWAAEPPGVTLGRLPERMLLVEILDILRGIESTERASAGEEQVLGVLQRRDQVVRQALEHCTFRALASEPTQSQGPRSLPELGRETAAVQSGREECAGVVFPQEVLSSEAVPENTLCQTTIEGEKTAAPKARQKEISYEQE
jgi:DNA-binding IscR family transcriptional regulator